jgi:hypothetical protein
MSIGRAGSAPSEKDLFGDRSFGQGDYRGIAGVVQIRLNEYEYLDTASYFKNPCLYPSLTA